MFRNTESFGKHVELYKLINEANRKNSSTGQVNDKQRLINIGMYLH